MFGTIYVLTNPFLSFLCIDSIKALRFEPFAPIADNKDFKRLVFAISRFEVEGDEGVEGVLTCGVVGVYGCAFECNPYKCTILIELWFRKISLLTSIYHTTDTTAPVLQECCFE